MQVRYNTAQIHVLQINFSFLLPLKSVLGTHLRTQQDQVVFRCGESAEFILWLLDYTNVIILVVSASVR